MRQYMLLPLLLLLGVVARAQSSDETLAVVGSKLIPWSEFMQSYTVTHPDGESSVSQMQAYLPLYIRTRVLLAEAESLRLDTLSAYRQTLASMAQLANEGAVSFQSVPVQKGSIWVEHFFVPMSQHATFTQEQAMRQAVNAIYENVRNGQTLSEAAAVCPGAKVSCHWLAPYETLWDVEAAAFRLAEGEISSPVLSTDGYHILRCLKQPTEETDRASVAVSSAPKTNNALQKAYGEGLLLQLLYQQIKDKARNDAAGLHHYFSQHQKQYAWSIPHFKGAVFHCKDKKTQKAVKKLLAKRPQYTWSGLMADSTYSHIFRHVKCSEPRLYALGQDCFVDYWAFGGPKPTEDAEFPVSMILGSKQKNLPESYLDVKELVVMDYQRQLEQDWYEQLYKKHAVVVNDKLWKKILR